MLRQHVRRPPIASHGFLRVDPEVSEDYPLRLGVRSLFFFRIQKLNRIVEYKDIEYDVGVVVDLVEWAADRPTFTVNEAERVTGLTRASLREKLSRLAKRGELNRIERGRYTVHDDPLIFATHIETPSFLSLWSGLRFYDLTTQQPTRVQVIAATNRGDLADIDFYYSSDMFGFGRERYAGFDVFVADEERLLLDCLARDRVPVSEVRDLVSMVDVETVTRYADRFDSTAVKKRLGYLLDVVRGESVAELRIRDRNYPVLDLTRSDEGTTNARWRLRVNTDVITA